MRAALPNECSAVSDLFDFEKFILSRENECEGRWLLISHKNSSLILVVPPSGWHRMLQINLGKLFTK